MESKFRTKGGGCGKVALSIATFFIFSGAAGHQARSTFGAEIQEAIRLRHGLTSGFATFLATSEVTHSSLGQLGETFTGEIRFDPSAYTNRFLRTETRGFTFTHTGSDGVRHKGLDSDDVILYVRRPLTDLKGPRFTIDVNPLRLPTAVLEPQEWEALGLHRDLLAIGFVIPAFIKSAELDKMPLIEDADGLLHGSGNFGGKSVEVAFSPKLGHLIQNATVIKDGIQHILKVEEFQTVGTQVFPRRVLYSIIGLERGENNRTSLFENIRINDGSKAFPIPLKKGDTIYGSRDNSVYTLDAKGNPVFAMRKGKGAHIPYTFNFANVGSMALLLFVASGTLVRSLLKRRTR